MNERLIVYLRGSRIGFIEFDHNANSREFSYDAAYLNSPGACPISLSLPLREKPFNSWETRLFFENLLPPEIVRRKLEKIIHHDHDNCFAFLKTQTLAEEMSDEGYSSPIYARIGEVIREQGERVS